MPKNFGTNDIFESGHPVSAGLETTQSIQHIVIPESELLELPLSTYCCEICGLKVKTKANLRAHHVKTHRILKNEADVAFFTKQKNQITYIYHCPVVPCKHNLGYEAGFSTCSRLKQHYQNVHMVKTHKCDRCGDMFSTPSSHAYHLRFCGKVFSCPVCPRQYTLKKHLSQHFRRTGHRPINKSSGIIKHSSDQTSKRERSLRPIEPDKNEPVEPVNSYQQTTDEPRSMPVVFPIMVLPAPIFNSDTMDISGSLKGPMPMCPMIYPPNFVLPMGLGSTSASVHLMSILQSIACTIQEANSQLNSTQYIPPPASFVDCGTQTDSSSPRHYQSDAIATTSVNTCTDEDDIREFIGSLFCDASVETTFSLGDNPDVFENPLHVNDSLQNTSPSTIPSTGSEPCPNSEPVTTFSASDEGVQTGLVVSFDSVAMQTDGIQKNNVSAATSDSCWNFGSHLRAPLETPPPMAGSERVTLPPHHPSSIQNESEKLLEGRSGAFRNPPQTLSSISTLLNPSKSSNPYISKSYLIPKEIQSSEYVSNELAETGHFPSSQSIGLQSSPWSTPRTYSTMETQTLSDDLVSWLNSVHTQTSSPKFELNSFSDISVGDDDDFLSKALAAVEGDK